MGMAMDMGHQAHEHAGMGHSMMHMTFYSGKDVTLWFDFLTSSTWQGYCGLVALVVAAGFAHEGLYAFRVACSKAHTRCASACTSCCGTMHVLQRGA